MVRFINKTKTYCNKKRIGKTFVTFTKTKISRVNTNNSSEHVNNVKTYIIIISSQPKTNSAVRVFGHSEVSYLGYRLTNTKVALDIVFINNF